MAAGNCRRILDHEPWRAAVRPHMVEWAIASASAVRNALLLRDMVWSTLVIGWPVRREAEVWVGLSEAN